MQGDATDEHSINRHIDDLLKLNKTLVQKCREDRLGYCRTDTVAVTGTGARPGVFKFVHFVCFVSRYRDLRLEQSCHGHGCFSSIPIDSTMTSSSTSMSLTGYDSLRCPA
eukprot:3818477-Rhodomonas_salina.1